MMNVSILNSADTLGFKWRTLMVPCLNYYCLCQKWISFTLLTFQMLFLKFPNKFVYVSLLKKQTVLVHTEWKQAENRCLSKKINDTWMIENAELWFILNPFVSSSIGIRQTAQTILSTALLLILVITFRLNFRVATCAQQTMQWGTSLAIQKIKQNKTKNIFWSPLGGTEVCFK